MIMRIVSGFLLAVTVSSLSHAAIGIKMATELQVGAQPIIKPSIVAKEGMWARITQGDIVLELQPRREGETVSVAAKIGRQTENAIEWLGSPTLIAPLDDSAEAQVVEDDGSLKWRLKISPTLMK